LSLRIEAEQYNAVAKITGENQPQAAQKIAIDSTRNEISEDELPASQVPREHDGEPGRTAP
jgi:hypothetical protein